MAVCQMLVINIFGAVLVGLLNDLHMFDINKLVWIDLTGNVSGPAPKPRQSHGFTTCNDKLFLFGGWDGKGMNAFQYDSKCSKTYVFFLFSSLSRAC